MNDAEQQIIVTINVKMPVAIVWKLWTSPEDIALWNNISEEWHNPKVEISLEEGGRFFFRMETKDGSDGFDYTGKYDTIINHKLIALTTDDGRKAVNVFESHGSETTIKETFEPTMEVPADMQRDFCQGILNSFKKYAESKEE